MTGNQSVKRGRQSLGGLVAGLALILGSTAWSQGVVHVNVSALPGGDGSSWATAYDGLQAALDDVAASGGALDTIWVAAGTYVPSVAVTPTDPRTRTFLLPAGVDLTVYGGFAGGESVSDQRDPILNPTILSGDFLGDDLPGFVNRDENAYHVVTAAGSTSFTLDGVTVTGGNADGLGADQNGGGLHGSGTGDWRIENCVFTSNRCAGSGGGAWILAAKAGSTIEVRGTTFLDNEAGAHSGGSHTGLFGPFETVRITGCLYQGNTAVLGGGGGSNVGGLLLLEDTTLLSNQGGAAGNGGGFDTRTRATVRRCRFQANDARGGGALSHGQSLGSNGNLRLSDTLLVGNTASLEGGALRVATTDFADLANCTMTGNAAPNGAAVWSEGTSVTVFNSIAWGDVGPLELAPATASYFVQYSDIEGGAPGFGNFDLDPLLSVGGFLQEGSPCIDRGSNNLLGGAQVGDAKGDPRRVDEPNQTDLGVGTSPVVDVGAHEFQTLTGGPASLSVGAGGTYSMELDVGPGYAGDVYFVLGSFSGTTPGFPYAGFLIPLNPDPYFNLTLNRPNLAPLANTFGVLDGAGTGAAGLTIPAGQYPTLAGVTAHHAFGALNPADLALRAVSNVTKFAFTP